MEANRASSASSNSSQKRPAQDAPETVRAKRGKYTSTACNECKRCKIKCIRFDDVADCQRCSSMNVGCIVVPTASQCAKDRGKDREKTHVDDYKRLIDEVSVLRQQLTTLTGTVAAWTQKQESQPISAARGTPFSQQTTSPSYTSITTQRTGSPRQPPFAGPTRAAFSLNIVESSLQQWNITAEKGPEGRAPSISSRGATPENTTLNRSGAEVEGLQDMSGEEIVRLLHIYQEEVACVHPIIETEDLISDAPQIMEIVTNSQKEIGSQRLGHKDAHILRLAIATAITHEIHGKNDLSERLIHQVEQNVGKISCAAEVELKDIQIFGMLSLYFCHTEDELFSWRAIGQACRLALEMGLHRKQSLLDNFKRAEERKLAIQVFWVVYELDRRWSFGTSLSFALHDRDIDTPLPELKAYPYLEGMIAYARLCSRVWEALPPYGSASHAIPKETEDYLEFITSNWLESIPQELQLRHPRLGLAPKCQPRLLHRLRTLIYLRGNYLRTLIHRHHVLSPNNINADMASARLVVDIAQDSIQVLVHLNDTSDIYARQQSVYHYYLLSALAVILLAVCHAPSKFAEASRGPFVSAIDLVKEFSRHGTSSRRLMKTIRGILPFAKSLGLHEEAEVPTNEAETSTSTNLHLYPDTATETTNTWCWNGGNLNMGTDISSMPDIFNIGNGLIDLYDAFGTQSLHPDALTDGLGEQSLSEWEIEEISRHFQGLI